MANRTRNGSGGAVTVREALEMEAPIFVPDVPSSVEDRLAMLDAELEKHREIIRAQSLTIAENVEIALRLRMSRAEITRLEARWHDARKAAADAKKSYEAGVAAHFELEDDLYSPQGRLPFPDEAAPPADRDDDWRAVSLARLGIADELPASLVERLTEGGIRTVGDLSDFVKPAAGGRCKALTDLPGVGAAKAERIERALDDFWKARAVALPGAGDEVRAGVEEVERRRARAESDPDEDPDDDDEANGSDRDEDNDDDELGFDLEDDPDDEPYEEHPDDER